MDQVVLLSRLILAVTFFLAGLTKLRDQKGTKDLLKNFRVPVGLVTPLAGFLPIAELLVAFLLLPKSSVWWGALGAFALLSLFTITIALNVLQGNKPECHCFGQLSSSPISWKTLLRNSILLALADVVVWKSQNNPGPGILAWAEHLSIVEHIQVVLGIAAGIAFAVLGLIINQLWRQQGRFLLRLEALEGLLPTNSVVHYQNALNGVDRVGTKAPSFSLPDLSGKPISLQQLLKERKAIILLFLDPSCGPCNTLLPLVNRWQQDFASHFVTVIISKGNLVENQLKAKQYKLFNILLQKNYEVAQAFQVGVTPSAVLIEREGYIGSPVIEGSEAINNLVAQSIKDASSRGQQKIASVADTLMGLS